MASLGQRMVGAMQADVKTFQEIEADPTAIGQAVTVIVIAGVASLIGNVFRVGLIGGIMNLVLTLILYALWTFVIVLIGTKVMPEPTTKADFNEGFRVIGFTAVAGRVQRPRDHPVPRAVDLVRDLDLDARDRRHRGPRGPRLQQHGTRDHRLPDRLCRLLDRACSWFWRRCSSAPPSSDRWGASGPTAAAVPPDPQRRDPYRRVREVSERERCAASVRPRAADRCQVRAPQY